MSAPDAADATGLARAVLTRLLDAGVEHLVLCPGSRSAPLAFAAYDAERAGRLRLHTRTDERTAAFLALGLAKGSHRPVPVLCTSGTAAANLHPAVLEAAHAGVPLVALTADRPAALRGTGANQTTLQVGMYADAAPTVDVAAPEDLADLTIARDAPTHLNVQLAEPLVPDALGWVPEPSHPERPDEQASHREVLGLGPRTVVVAGDDAGPAGRRLAERAGWPLLAEPSSGSRTGDHAIRAYRLLLATDLGARVQRVVVLGHPTLSRPVTRLLARDDVEVVSVRARGRWPRRPHPVAVEVGPEVTLVADPDDPAWLGEWRGRDAEVVRRLDALVDTEAATHGLGPHAVAREVSRALRPGDQLVVGASNPVRDLDLVGRAHPVGERRKVLANRGLAGIDGTVSTAVGVALSRPDAHTYALIGDVTFLHDAGALVLGPGEPRPDLTVVVVNDDGGSIFAGLEQGAPEYAAAFERLFGTPHGTDLAALCAASRTPHWRVESLPELQQALASPNGGIEVVEARVPRSDRRALDARIRALAD
ncbi:2-succinyl-5-enolpyruvyl-6-hydroxy-3-cyclohexene-1-carboxylate synthase [Marmoricola endophyticus]|uniref:2-succinyl-5-enolpyruvyl-6-hydroxy-3-cyclohexene-1-carboxylate synthase n=1 Tax=Marmoricola endophyticus TaxID=2040280 RepID=A0A917F4D9_9ACTN|nr:2-succinyl-5-enolpyruvyl-6-hydroxy-3-cyclohexene-1-carboxylic-acid synthase [Marmoricola endophyticus]GGF45160.1 2-succinyl-5-enolpyruvyl-6-hydroxy-3-cyclohexene-1-carboxylate synthase [Marmoricola endophyticus]